MATITLHLSLEEKRRFAAEARRRGLTLSAFLREAVLKETLAEFDRALVLPMLDGLSHREIAQVTGLSENHVGVALLRARRRLAEKFKGAIDEME